MLRGMDFMELSFRYMQEMLYGGGERQRTQKKQLRRGSRIPVMQKMRMEALWEKDSIRST